MAAAAAAAAAAARSFGRRPAENNAQHAQRGAAEARTARLPDGLLLLGVIVVSSQLAAVGGARCTPLRAHRSGKGVQRYELGMTRRLQGWIERRREAQMGELCKQK